MRVSSIQDIPVEPCSVQIKGDGNTLILQAGHGNSISQAQPEKQREILEALLRENEKLKELVEMWKALAVG